MAATRRASRQSDDPSPATPCPACGAESRPGQRYCDQCGAALPATAALASRGQPPAESPAGVLEWGYRVPVLSRLMLWDVLRVMVLSVVVLQVVILLAGLVFARELVLLPWWVLGLVLGIVLGLALVAMAILHLIRTETRFRVDAEGVSWRSGQRETRLMRGIAILGLLTLNPRLAGSGMLASSATSGAVRWRDVSEVVVHRPGRALSLRTDWRTVQRVYCPADLFERVVATAEAATARAAARRPARPDGRRLSWGVIPVLVWCLLAVAAVVLAGAWYAVPDGARILSFLGMGLLLAAGLLGGRGRLLATSAATATAVFLVILFARGAETAQSMLGDSYRRWEIDTGLFWTSVAGGVLLLLMAVLLLAGRGPRDWWPGRPEGRRS